MMTLDFDHNLLVEMHSYKAISIQFLKQSKNKTINADLIIFVWTLKHVPFWDYANYVWLQNA
jgi:hypothetical protein